MNTFDGENKGPAPKNATPLDSGQDQGYGMGGELWQAVLASSPVGIGLSRGRTLLWGADTVGMHRMLGYEPGELYLRDAGVLYSDQEEYQKAGQALYPAVWRDGEAEVDTRWVRKDGGILEVRLKMASLTGQAEGGLLVCLAEDITAAKTAELSRVRAESKYQSLVEQLPATVYVAAIDPASTTSYVSPKVRELIGRAPEEFQRDPDLWVKLLHPEDRGRVLAAVAETHRLVKPLDLEYRLIAADGSMVWVRDVANLLLDQEGRPVALQGVMQDVTNRVQEERAFQALMETISGQTGQAFFDTLVSRAIGWLGADIMLVGAIGEGGMVDALAMVRDGQPVYGFSYSMAGTPCEEAAHVGYCHYPDHVAQAFPKYEGLTRLMVRGYVGAPLLDDDGTPLGIICAMTHGPFHLPKRAEEVLKILADRAASEISRRRLDAALLASHEQMRGVLEHSPSLIFLKDAKGRFQLVNREFEEAHGLHRREVIGKSHWEVFPPETANLFDKSDRAVISGRQPVTELETLNTEAGRRSFVTTKFPILDPDGQVGGLGGIATEITEQQRIAESLKQVEQFNRTIIQSSRDCITVLDLKGRLVFINRHGQDQLGLEGQGSMQGVYYPDLWRGVHRQASLSALGLARAGGVGEFIGRVQTSKGPEKWWEVVISSIKGPKGKVESLLAVSRDITDRKKAEEELARYQERLEELVAERTLELEAANLLLREEVEQRRMTEEDLRNSEKAFRALLNATQEAALLMDLSGEVLAINQVAAESVGATPSELVGKDVRDYISDAAYHLRVRQGRQAMRSGRPVRFEDQEAGVIRDITMYPVAGGDGRVEKLAVFARDVTAQRQAEQALAKSEKFLRSVLNALSAEVAILNREGRVLETNRAWRDFALANGGSPGASDGANYLQVLDLAEGEQAEYAVRAAAGIRGVLEGEVEDFVMSYPCHGPDEQRWFLMRVKSMSGAGPGALVVSHENITNVMLAEQAVRESEERLRRAVEYSPLPVMIHAENGEVIALSKSWTQLSGYTMADIPTLEEWLKRAHGERYREILGAIKDLYAVEGKVDEGDFTITCKDGGKRVWHFSSAPLGALEDGRRLVSSVAMDVTEAREAAEKIRILARFPDENPNPVLRVGPDGELQYANLAARSILEADGEGEPGRLIPQIQTPLRQVLENGASGRFEVQIQGRLYIFSVSALAGTGAIYLYGQDETERRALEREQKLAARVFENSVEGIIIADATGKVQMVNPAFSEITGFAADEVEGREMNIMRAVNHSPQFFEEVWAGLTQSGQWSGEYMNRRKNGEAYPEWLTVNLLRDAEGRPTNYIAIFHDITEIKRSQEQIRYQAHHDALTGLPNRALFADRLSQSINHAARHFAKLGILFLDLDNFKNINDSLGHDVGDELLVEVSRRLSGCLREEDTVARLGGDEFIMILNDLSGENGAVRVAAKVLNALEKPVVVRGHELKIGASIGITLFPDDADNAETLLKYADLAMYRAKERGRNNYQLFTPAMNQTAMERLSLEGRLRRALEREEFLLHYQPRLDLAQGRIWGVEALIRWQRPDGSLSLPGEFIAVAEESGLIVPMGEWVLHRACERAKHWESQGMGELTVSVNLSARQFSQQGLDKMIARAIGQTGLDPNRLELEITETTMMRDVKSAVDILNNLAQLGVTFSVDDFGTGYSSLYYLKHLPIDALKIDYTFVRDIVNDSNDAAIVETIINMGHSLRLLVVAEGVETEEQLQFLRAKGCDQAQGFHICRPRDEEDLKSFWEQFNSRN